MFTPLTIEESKNKFDEGMIVIDVRYEKEHNSLRIPGSHSIFINDLSKNILEEKFGENKDILLHCTRGVKSKVAARKLLDEGYQGKIFEIDQGLMGWVEQGLPTESD